MSVCPLRMASHIKVIFMGTKRVAQQQATRGRRARINQSKGRAAASLERTRFYLAATWKRGRRPHFFFRGIGLATGSWKATYGRRC